MRFARLLLFCVLSCGSTDGDPHSEHGVPPPSGKDLRIKQITDPASDKKAKDQDTVALSGVMVVAYDTHDETSNGKSAGTVYIQDVGSQEPYSGLSVFSASFVPGNLRVGEGDVLDMTGQYVEAKNIGSTVTFATGAPLPQMFRPTATFREEVKPIEPKDIDVKDLQDYATGRKWLNMLVRVKDVTVLADVIESGNSPRVSAPMLPGNTQGKCEDPFPKPPVLVNELANLNSVNLKANTKVKEIVGVVTYFCNLHLAPRSPADIKIN